MGTLGCRTIAKKVYPLAGFWRCSLDGAEFVRLRPSTYPNRWTDFGSMHCPRSAWFSPLKMMLGCLLVEWPQRAVCHMLSTAPDSASSHWLAPRRGPYFSGQA